MFNNIPQNWKRTELELVASIEYGTRIVKDSSIGNEYYVYGGGDKTFQTDKYNRENALIVARFGMSPKCTRFVKGKFFLNDSGLTVSTKDKNLLDQSFLNWQLRFLNDLIYSLGNGVAQKNLNVSRFKQINIVIPSIEEQKEIVQVLDAMSEIIRLREECIQHAQDLIPALFQEMFGDSNNNVSNSKIVRLGECIELNPAKPNLANDFNVTFLGMKDVSENGQIDLSTIKTYEEVKKGFTNFENDDVLLAKITPCFENGKAAIVRNLTNGYGFGSTEFYVLRANQNIILPEYVYSIIKSFAFAIPGRQKMTGAAGQKRLPKGYILNYKIPLPDLELQIQYAEKLNEINSYIKEQQEELENANQMFQSLLHQAFTGELTKHKFGGKANA